MTGSTSVTESLPVTGSTPETKSTPVTGPTPVTGSTQVTGSTPVSESTPVMVTDSTSTTASTGNSFASTTALLAQNGEKWKLAKARKEKKVVTVVGQKEGGVLEGVPPTTRLFWDISVNRLKDSLSSDKIKTYLQGHGIEVKEVWLLNSGIKGAKTAKIRVAREHKERVKEAELWPKFSKIRDWTYLPRNVVKDKRPTVAEGANSSLQ